MLHNTIFFIRSKKKQQLQKHITKSGSPNSANDTEANVCSDMSLPHGDQVAVSSPGRGKFVAITQYVDTRTDIQQLLRIHLGESGKLVDIPRRDLNSVCDSPGKCLCGASPKCAHSMHHAPALATTEICRQVHQEYYIQLDNVSASQVDEMTETKKCGASSKLTPTSVENTAVARSLEIEDNPLILYMLGGLHACGDLTSNTLRLFVKKSAARVLCNVGCCYNHLTEAFIRCPFGRGGKYCTICFLGDLVM
jgi:hypothetical protein